MEGVWRDPDVDAEKVTPAWLRNPDPWKLGAPAADPSPALKGTLSPSDGERDGVRGPTSIPGPTPIQAFRVWGLWCVRMKDDWPSFRPALIGG